MNCVTDFLDRLLLDGPSIIRSTAVNAYGRVLKQRRFGGKFDSLWNWTQQSQWWAEPEIAEFQGEKLRHLLTSAALQVPYYRRLFAATNFDPATARLPEDLPQLPVLTRETIKRNTTALRVRWPSRWRNVRQFTSGTTGHRLDFWLPKVLAYSLNAALMWRQYGWAGVRRGDRRVTLGGRHFSRKPPFSAYNSAENQLLLSVHCLNARTVDTYVDQLVTFAPAFVQGNPSAISLIAERLAERSLCVPVKAVFTTGETLNDDQRAMIECCFKARVMESYGLGEMVVAAHQCEFGEGFHAAVELGIMEFIESGHAGLKSIVGTSLWNDTMPFVRYQIEDLVEPAPNRECRCGRRLPVLFRRVIGRIDDRLHDDDGNVILPVTVRMQVKPHLDPFENYQVRQLTGNAFELWLTAVQRPGKEDRLRSALLSVLGHSAQVSFMYAASIQTQGGKLRNVIDCRNGERPN